MPAMPDPELSPEEVREHHIAEVLIAAVFMRDGLVEQWPDVEEVAKERVVLTVDALAAVDPELVEQARAEMDDRLREMVESGADPNDPSTWPEHWGGRGTTERPAG